MEEVGSVAVLGKTADVAVDGVVFADVTCACEAVFAAGEGIVGGRFTWKARLLECFRTGLGPAGTVLNRLLAVAARACWFFWCRA